MNIIQLYTDILNACGCKVDHEGFVSVDPSVFTGEKSTNGLPFIVNEKRVVLPIDAQLRSGNQDKIVFHPLNENILRGESDVVMKLRAAFTIRINHLFFIAVKTAVQMIYDHDNHKKFNPNQHEILSIAPDLNEDTAVDLVRMMRNATAQNPNCFVSLFLKRSGSVDGKKYSRVGVVGFPFYNELKKEQDTYYGVKLRKRDRAGLIKLMENIFPNIEKEGEYNRGSNSQVAPYMDSLMKTVMSVGSKLNDYFETYRNVISGFEEGLIISSDWVDAFDNLDSNAVHIRKIPVQAGNEGSTKQEGAVNNVATAQPSQQTTYITPPQPVVQQPQQVIQPQIQQPINQVNTQPIHHQTKQSGKASFSDFANHVAPGTIPPSMMMSDPMMAQQMQYLQQMQNMQMMQNAQRANGARSTSAMVNSGVMYPQQMMPGMMPGVNPAMYPAMNPAMYPNMQPNMYNQPAMGFPNTQQFNTRL